LYFNVSSLETTTSCSLCFVLCSMYAVTVWNGLC